MYGDDENSMNEKNQIHAICLDQSVIRTFHLI